MTLIEIVKQLKTCNYTCEAGKLEDNIAFKELENIIELSKDIDFEEDQISWNNVITGGIIEEQLNNDDNESD